MAGRPEASSWCFDLRAFLLICVHLRSNFLRLVGTGIDKGYQDAAGTYL
jgi:hypothetical protein